MRARLWATQVVRLDIEALARMAPDAAHFIPLCEHLLQLLRHERALLERRGAPYTIAMNAETPLSSQDELFDAL